MDPSELLNRLSQTLEELHIPYLVTGSMATIASPEDVIIKKLAFFQEGGSEKHLSDIRGVLVVMGEQLDRGYIEKWVSRRGLTREWLTVAKQ